MFTLHKAVLIGKNGIDTKAGRAQYQVTGDNFKLAEGQNELSGAIKHLKKMV